MYLLLFLRVYFAYPTDSFQTSSDAVQVALQILLVTSLFCKDKLHKELQNRLVSCPTSVLDTIFSVGRLRTYFEGKGLVFKSHLCGSQVITSILILFVAGGIGGGPSLADFGDDKGEGGRCLRKLLDKRCFPGFARR